MDGAVFVRTAYHPKPILPLIEACARGTDWMGRSPWGTAQGTCVPAVPSRPHGGTFCKQNL